MNISLGSFEEKNISIKLDKGVWVFDMRHPSAYLEWYIRIHEAKYDLRSSGITGLKYNINLGEVNLSANYAHGNPETAKLLARRYRTQLENVFISSEGASGQNARITRYLAERNPKKTEAIVEYPTYEPLLRQVQDHFRRVKRFERREKEAYKLDADELRKLASEKTCLLALTNPHAPSGVVTNANELEEIMEVAREYDFLVFCDEIYAEFDRNSIPSAFSVDSEHGVVTTSFTKAYGLGGLKLGIALADKKLVDELYMDVLNTVGNSPNVVQLLASDLLMKGWSTLEQHEQKWVRLKKKTEKWFNENGIEYFRNSAGVTYWAKLPLRDTYKWINEFAIPRYGVAPVPGAFFLFKSGYKLARSNMVRVGIGNIDPDKPNLSEALKALKKSIDTYGSTG
jgi:aspartate/methionine/tyrosine aminotransferase